MAIPDVDIFKIGGLGLGLSAKPGWKFTSNRYFQEFTSNDTPVAVYQVKNNPASGMPAGNLVFDSGQSWRLFENLAHKVLWIGSRDFTPRIVGKFNADFSEGEIFVAADPEYEGRYLFPLGYPMGELITIHLLGMGKGIMLHSCGVIDEKQGLVFAGNSSAGKTTTARLWNAHPGVQVLNDDHTIVRKIKGQFRVFGTPWPGEGGFAVAEDAALDKLFILKQASSNIAEKLSPAQAAAALLARSFVPLWDSKAMEFTLHFLDELCRTIPCYTLGFVPDQSAVEYVRCFLSS